MPHSGVSPPKRFWFKCYTCGQYPVTERTMRKFLTRPLQKKLDAALRDGAEGAVLSFENGCPNCKPNNEKAVIELSVLRRRVH